MTNLFMLMFLAGMQTADAHHKHKRARTPPPPKHHHVRPAPRPKPKPYRHAGHKYYTDHDGLVWIWKRGHWLSGRWIRGHWEISIHL